MPKIPTYDTFTAGQTGFSGSVPETLSPSQAAMPGQQLKQFGEGQLAAGNAESDIALDKQDTANSLRVIDAMNQARQHAIDLTNDPNSGYASLKGKDALQRPGGVSLADEYGQKLNEYTNSLSSTLGNPMQQRMFHEQSQSLLTDFHSGVESHMMQQYHDFGKSTLDGANDLARQDAAQNWNNPDVVQKNIEQQHAAIAGMQKFEPMSANEVLAKQKEASSKTHSMVVDTALQNNNMEYAQGYFDKNRQDMTGEDVLATQGKINPKMDAYASMHAVGQTMQSMSSRMMPTERDRLSNIMFGQESGNKQFGGAGSVAGPNEPTTSAKGAIGLAQIMPATGPEAAKLAGVPWDEGKYKNDPDYNRKLGNAYMDQQLKEFGDTGKALAAYNAGPQAVRDAVDESKKNYNPGAMDYGWLSHMPAETQGYVNTIQTQLGDNNAGIPPLPSKAEWVNDAIGRLGDNPRVERVVATRENAEKQYDLAIAARKQLAEAAQGRVQEELRQNNGNVSQLSLASQADMSFVNRVDPSAGDSILRYAKYAPHGKEQTNYDVLGAAQEDPAKYFKVSDTQFENWKVTNFSPEEGAKISKQRADFLSGKSDDPDSLNAAAVKSSFDERWQTVVGDEPKQKTGKLGSADKEYNARLGEARAFINDDIRDQQKQLGRKMSQDEINDRIDTVFNNQVFVPGFSSYLPSDYGGDAYESQMAIKFNEIPQDARAKITADLTSKGNKNPADLDILREYWRTLAKGAKNVSR